MQRNPPLGCISFSGIGATLAVLVLVVGVGLFRGGWLFSPGGLNAKAGAALGSVRSHAEIVDCAQCHTAPWSSQTMAAQCQVCHADLADANNFHHVLLSQSGPGCTACHTEHHGPAASLTVIDPKTYPHDLMGYSLKAHQKKTDGTAFACTDCHAPSYPRFDLTVCAACHAQIDASFMQAHTAAYGPGCLACHDGLDSYGKAFNHQTVAFKLTGKHTNLDCGRCHSGARTIADLKAAPTQCVACHAKDDVHKGGLGQDCGACHTPDDWTNAKIDHSKTAFPLLGKHQAVACQACHVNNVFKGTPKDCVACHAKDDVHQGDLGQDCAKCHNPGSWADATLDHSLTSFPLVGKHLSASCASCHVNNVFKGTPKNCYSCHAKDDAHKGQFGQDCAPCHTAAGWLPSTFDHSQGPFPLTGAHVKVACEKCHLPGPNGPTFVGTPTACSACHQDPAFHAGLFGANCAGCHSTAAWIPARFNGPHSFPINHGGAGSCRQCHPSSLNGYTCFTCHPQGEMVSRHREEGINDISNCVRCHANGQGGG